jgi:integrase
MAKLSIYKYVRSNKGWRYSKATFHPNGKIKPDVVIVDGREEKHSEGSYFLSFNRQWLPVGSNALEAQRKRAVRLAQMEYERLSGKAVASKRGSTSVQFADDRKLIQVEVDAYLSNLELAKRPCSSINDKRRFLTDFLALISKTYADQFNRDDVLKFRNHLMKEYEPKSVDTQMMAVVTFFNRWLKIKLGMEASDWPEYRESDPEPYLDEEIVGMEKVSSGIPNLLIRLFRSTGCRDMEIAHLYDTDISPRTKEILIRQKPCRDCKKCRSRGNVWKPKTKAGTRSIPISDSLLKELLALGKGLLFPNADGRVDGHFLRKVKRAVKKSGVANVKLHRLRDTFITNKLRDHEDIRTVQKWAGHDDVNVTMSYSAWLDSQSEAARNAANREDTRYKTDTQGDQSVKGRAPVSSESTVVVTGTPSG